MRIDSVYIESFKNLNQFTIDFDKDELNTVLLGQNATGKSNFIEVLVLIFKYLDLSDSTKRLTPNFEYIIKYVCRDKVIGVECVFDKKTNKNGYKLKIDDKKITLKSFFGNKKEYLPKYVFTYYSGVSNKLKNLFDDNQEKFYNKIISDDVTKDEVEDLRRMFYVQLVHSYFVLLAFYTFEEDRTQEFLTEYLQIEDLDSVLFKFHQKPNWAKRGKSFQETFMWGAKGLVREFLDKLWTISLAPIDNVEKYKENFRDSDNKSMEYLYLFISSKENLQKLKEYYKSNTDLFKALESTYISDLIKEVKVNVRKKNVDGNVTFKELSEGEQQLLTVLGLLKFTKDKETLVLLDEPDTHLNPLWKWEYLDLLKNIYKKDANGKEDDTTHIIINTHDPLVIGGLEKEQVRIFKRNVDDGRITVEKPNISPKGLGISGILTSELFGLTTVLDKETQSLLDERNNLLFKESENRLDKNGGNRLKELFELLNNLGFSQTLNDPLYTKFVIAYQKLNVERNKIKDEKISSSWNSSNKAYELLKNILDKRK